MHVTMSFESEPWVLNISSIISNNISFTPTATNSTLVIKASASNILSDWQKQTTMVLRLLGIIASLLNVSVLASPRLKEPLFKYLLVMAVVDMSYSLLVQTLSTVYNLCFPVRTNVCGPGLELTALFLFIIVSDFLTSSLALMNILLEIFLTLQRVIMITNKRSKLRGFSVTRVCWTMFGVSLLLYFPYILMHKIEKVASMPISAEANNNTILRTSNGSNYHYRKTMTEFGGSALAFWFRVTVNVIRVFFVVVILSVLNCVAICKFNAYFSRKLTMKQNNCKFRICFFLIL
jgi:hypothetical protein